MYYLPWKDVKKLKVLAALKLVSVGASWCHWTPKGLSVLLFFHPQLGGFVPRFVPLLISGWPQLSQVSYPQTAASRDRKGDDICSRVFKEWRGTSLVAQWLRIHPAVKSKKVPSPVGGWDPTCVRANNLFTATGESVSPKEDPAHHSSALIESNK